MSRQDANAAFALSSFLQGTNATYIDELYARYEQDPASVDAEWQEFFKSLKDTPADVQRNAEGPSWGRDNWPLTPRDELTSALDGNWITVEKAVGAKLAAKAQAKGAELSAADVNQATRDSVRALMLIRAYRMRGHFHAKLDPLGIEAPRDRERADVFVGAGHAHDSALLNAFEFGIVVRAVLFRIPLFRPAERGVLSLERPVNKCRVVTRHRRR